MYSTLKILLIKPIKAFKLYPNYKLKTINHTKSIAKLSRVFRKKFSIKFLYQKTKKLFF